MVVILIKLGNLGRLEKVEKHIEDIATIDTGLIDIRNRRFSGI